MTTKQRLAYQETEILRAILQEALYGQKFRLDCGHHVTFGEMLGNDIAIRNGKKFEIVCSLCNQ